MFNTLEKIQLMMLLVKSVTEYVFGNTSFPNFDGNCSRYVFHDFRILLNFWKRHSCVAVWRKQGCWMSILIGKRIIHHYNSWFKYVTSIQQHHPDDDCKLVETLNQNENLFRSVHCSV
jgi:hypothetical protein